MSGKHADLRPTTTGKVCPAFRETDPDEVFRGREPTGLVDSAAISSHQQQPRCMPEDIHTVWNGTDKVSLSLHTYGKHIMTIISSPGVGGASADESI
jgi:hypothetical protein